MTVKTGESVEAWPRNGGKQMRTRLSRLFLLFFPKYSQTPPCILFNAIYKKEQRCMLLHFHMSLEA